MYPSARSAASSTSLCAICTEPPVSRQAQAPQTPWRQEYGASSPASISTSSIRVPAGHGSEVTTPSSVTDSVAATPPSTRGTDSNGFSASDTNRSARTRAPGTPSSPSAERTVARYGSGPQTYASNDTYGRAKAARAAAEGSPSSESSQCTTTSRPPESTTSRRNAEPKRSESESRLAYTSTTRPRPEASADFRIDITGVIPLPAANSKKSPANDEGQNVPAGGSTSSTVPAVTRERIQFDAYPPAVRLTVMAGRSPASGELDSE